MISNMRGGAIYAHYHTTHPLVRKNYAGWFATDKQGNRGDHSNQVHDALMATLS
jgi:hypothetical protein